MVNRIIEITYTVGFGSNSLQLILLMRVICIWGMIIHLIACQKVLYLVKLKIVGIDKVNKR